jgi:hypothetical protein
LRIFALDDCALMRNDRIMKNKHSPLLNLTDRYEKVDYSFFWDSIWSGILNLCAIGIAACVFIYFGYLTLIAAASQ